MAKSLAATPESLPVPGTSSINIRVQSDVELPRRDEIFSAITSGLREHFSQTRAGTYRQVDITVSVVEWNWGSLDTAVAIAVFGRINGRAISQTFSDDRSTGAFGKMGKLGESVLTPNAKREVSQVQQECLENCLDKICVAMDRAAGLAAPVHSKIWSVISVGVPLVAGIAGVLAVFMTAEEGAKGFGTAILVAGGVYLMLYFPALAFMPTQFFRVDPRGRRVLARSGVKNLVAFRVLAMLVPVVVAAIPIVAYSILHSDRRRANAAPPQAGEPAAAQPVVGVAPTVIPWRRDAVIDDLPRVGNAASETGDPLPERTFHSQSNEMDFGRR
ncbi:MAG: hypothetical protein HUU20_22590 [Pirellulales bacterium]|nr:hypothetical protein [Pirellulales bacterium]